jgi:hypothetical protein
MSAPLRKYSALFLLFLFIFPMAEKQLHAFEHKADSHCTATDKHFHSQEHNCDLCDLTTGNSAPLAENNFVLAQHFQNFSFNPFIRSCYSATALLDLPARAPPTV